MKVLKYIFLTLLVLIVLGSIYLATLDGEYDVKRSRIIGATPELVFNDLNDYKNWKDWGPWYEQDSTIKAIYPEITVGEGSSYSWISKDGEGSMHTIKVDKPNSLDQEILFKTPFGDMKSDVYWKLENVDNGTNLTWGMKGKLDFIWRFMSKGMADDLGPMLERGLELFDENIQRKLKVHSVRTDGVVDFTGGHYLYTTISCKIEDIGSKFPELMMKVGTYVSANNIRVTGGPFSLYHKYDENNGTTMFSVCFPIAQRLITEKGSDILYGFMEKGKYFKTTLTGSYENLQKAWESAMTEVMNLGEFKMVEKGEPFELYVNDPRNTPNPAELITEIYIPVE